ncbi:putative sulfate transporter 3.5 [Senna tora]|uniref:Putative sulfate transporter 3.5 n=1 Tax=Senna tora TaxID=362788 RepID=A0A834W9Y0_9FABA|nr:putative sulfate transporter 3.5 [Senna tora]
MTSLSNSINPIDAGGGNGGDGRHAVSFAAPRGFGTKLKSAVKETLFPDDPFRELKNEEKARGKIVKGFQYFVPIFEWLPSYNLRLFFRDFLAGLTITSLAIPQGISYAKLADIPPINGLYSSFVPPLVYAIFGSSRHVAVGTVAAASLLLYQTISSVVNPEDDPALYLHLVFTATFITGIFQTALGVLRLGILVDFFSHSTITGFMGGTAVILCLQQLKGVFGLKHFTTKTSVVAVVKAIWTNRNEKKKNPKLFLVSAVAPITTVIIGAVGHLDRGLNHLSIHYFNFDPKYLPTVLKAGIITGILSLAEGIAIGRSFAVAENTPHDGNKEMVAFGLMNLCGSFTSCYLTSGPFSKTAVNYNAGCKTAMSNIVQGAFMALTLLFLAPLFGYTPLVSLSAIIMSAMLGLIDYEEAIRLFKVDKFDFLICISCFLGVTFISMDVGLFLSIGLGVLRGVLYVARPAPCKLGKLPHSSLYRDMEQYPTTPTIPGVLIIQLGSPLHFANSSYVKDRIMRYIQTEESSNIENNVEHIILDLSGVTSIDVTAIDGLLEIRKILGKNGKQPLRLEIKRDPVSTYLDSGSPADGQGAEDAFELLHEINELVKAGIWVGDCFIYNNSSLKLNYCVGVAKDLDYRFDLALQLSRVDIAEDIAIEAQSHTKWKQLGELALSSGKISKRAAETLVDPEEDPNLLEDWHIALDIESKVA